MFDSHKPNRDHGLGCPIHRRRGVSGHLSVHENSLRDDGWMLGKGGNAHREELLQHPAVVFLQRDLVSLHGVHSDEVGMLLIPLAVRDALQQHQNEFQTPGRRAEILGSGKLLPSFQPGVSKHPKNPQSQQCIPLAEVVPALVRASREERGKGWMKPLEQDMGPRKE